jgi:hypothetical protein
MHDIYSVKVRNVTPAAVLKGTFRASYFPYERFYLFHEEDLAAGLVDRMFYVYLLHRMDNPTIQESVRSNIDITEVVTLGAIQAKKATKISDNIGVNCRVNWHVKDIAKHLLVVPTYSRKVTPELLAQEEVSHVGYTRSKCCTENVEDYLGSLPDLIVNKENLQHPCIFCDHFLEGFQTGTCKFGDAMCRRYCRIFLPEKRLEIKLGED